MKAGLGVRRLAAAFRSASLLAPKQASANEGGGKPPHSIKTSDTAQ
jgi:hypothetical protein